jgi:hypothetical protein
VSLGHDRRGGNVPTGATGATWAGGNIGARDGGSDFVPLKMVNATRNEVPTFPFTLAVTMWVPGRRRVHRRYDGRPPQRVNGAILSVRYSLGEFHLN